ncbi:MAG: MATE family efflux transporter, partial [Bradymonadaceae bacterium]
MLTWLVFGWGAGLWAELFVEGAETADRLALFLVIVPAGYAAQGLFLIGNAALNAIDRPVPAASLSLLRTLGLTAPLAWLGAHWFDLAGIFGSIAVANLVVGIAA